MFTKSLVKCVLCKANINLRRGNLDKFKTHLDSFHETVFDLDLVISISFLEVEEKERIVGTVFPRIKKFFKDLREDEEPRQLTIEKKLEEEGVLAEVRQTIRERSLSKKRELESKFESLKEDTVPPLKKRVKLEQNQQLESEIRVKNVEPETEITTEPSAPAFQHHNTRTSRNSPEEVEEVTEEVENTNAASEDEESPQKFVHPGESSCDICDKVMLKKSIRKHKQRVHHLYEEASISEESGPIRVQDSGHVTSLDQSETSVTEDDVIETAEKPEELLAQASPQNMDKVTSKAAANKNVNCEVCNKSIFKKNISRHMKTVHPRNEENDDTEDDDDKVIEDSPVEVVLREEEVAEADLDIDEVEEEAFSRGLVNESEVEIEKETEKETEKVEKDNEKDLRVECPQCHKRITRSNLRRHMKRFHEEDGPIRGQYAGHVTSADQSEAEEEEVMDQSELPEVIPVVESSSDQSEAEEDAMDQSVETRCKICFAVFEDKAQLSEHFSVVHEIDIEDFETLDNDEE